MSLPTASSLERALECPASCVMPAIHSGGLDAERGSAIGRFARDVLAGDPYEVALDRVPRNDWKSTCSALDFKAICGDLIAVRAEVAYGVYPEAMEGRQLGLNLGRKYPGGAELAALFGITSSPAAVFVGTNDLEGRHRDTGMEVVCDLKSGQEVTACAANPQMKFHALARYLVTGATAVEARLLYVRSDGRVFRDAHVFTAYELDGFADQLVDLEGRLLRARARYDAGEALDVNEGSWCAYCAAKAYCPAKTLLVRHMLGTLTDVSSRLARLTPEEAGKAWLMATEAEKLAKLVRDGLRDIARDEPLRTRPGKIVRAIESHHTTFAEGAALALLRELGATQGQIDCLFVETPTHPIREVNEIQKAKGARR